MSDTYAFLRELLLLLFADDDLMTQDSLFKAQDMVSAKIYQLAIAERQTEDLIKTFPYLFYREVAR